NPNDPTLTTPFQADLVFNASGQLDIASLASADFTVNADGTLNMNNWVPAAPDSSVPPVWSANGAAAATAGVNIDLRDATQFASSFAVTEVAQDGYTTGQLSGLEID